MSSSKPISKLSIQVNIILLIIQKTHFCYNFRLNSIYIENPNRLKEERSQDSELWIHKAIRSKNVNAVKMILSLYDQNESVGRTIDGNTVYHFAVKVTGLK